MSKPNDRGFFAWREWRLGIGRWKGMIPRLPALRPNVPLRIPAAWWARYLRLLGRKPDLPLTMYDSASVAAIPKNAQAVAGYVGGAWKTYPVLVKKFPKAKKLSIAVASYQDADCLDIEKGDAPVSLAASWVKRQHALGNTRPVVYTQVSNGQTLINLLKKAGFRYGVDYAYWSAHYTYKPHLCGPECGFGLQVTAHATQWTNKALGRTLDASLCSPSFF